MDIELSIEKAEVFQLSHVSFSLTNFLPHSFILPGSFHLSHFDEKQKKNQLYCLCLKMTADFGNFVNKTDKKQKMKDGMNPAIMPII